MVKSFCFLMIIFNVHLASAKEKESERINRFLDNPTSQNFSALSSRAKNDLMASGLMHGPTWSLNEDDSPMRDHLQNANSIKALTNLFKNLSESEKKDYYTFLYQQHIQFSAHQRPLADSPYKLEFEGFKPKTGAELHDHLFRLATGNDPARMQNIFCESFKGTAQIQNGEHLDDSFVYKESSMVQNELRIYKQRLHQINDTCEYTNDQGKKVKFRLTKTISELETMGDQPLPSNQPQLAQGQMLSNPDSYGIKSYCTEKQIRTSVNEALTSLYSPNITSSYGYRFNENGCVLYLDFRKEAIAKKSKQTRWNVYDIYRDMTKQVGDKLNSDTTFDKEDIIAALVKRQSKKPLATKPTSPQPIPQPAPAQSNESENSGGAIFSPFSKQ